MSKITIKRKPKAKPTIKKIVNTLKNLSVNDNNSKITIGYLTKLLHFDKTDPNLWIPFNVKVTKISYNNITNCYILYVSDNKVNKKI